MIKNSFLSLWLGLCISASAQDLERINFHSEFEANYFTNVDEALGRLLMADPDASDFDLRELTEKLTGYIQGLESKRSKFKRQEDFISFVFYKTHRKFLKRYTPYTSFRTLSKSGAYDCLSATSLYSYLFHALDIEHTIVETSYHIYIIANADNNSILLESTDPIYGYVKDKKEIQQRLAEINGKNAPANDQYNFVTAVNEDISFNELIGLQYYNSAVDAFNSQSYSISIEQLSKGLIFRNNPRLIEFALVVAQGIMQDEHLDQQLKLSYVTRLQELFHGNTALASR